MPHGITQCYLPPGRGDIPFRPSPSRSWYSIKRPRGNARLSCVRAVGRVSDRVRWDIDHAGAAATTNERTSDDDLVQLICRQEASNPQI